MPFILWSFFHLLPKQMPMLPAVHMQAKNSSSFCSYCFCPKEVLELTKNWKFFVVTLTMKKNYLVQRFHITLPVLAGLLTSLWEGPNKNYIWIIHIKKKKKQRHTLSPLIPGVPHSPLSPCKRIKKNNWVSSASHQLSCNNLRNFQGTIYLGMEILAGRDDKWRTKRTRDTWRQAWL